MDRISTGVAPSPPRRSAGPLAAPRAQPAHRAAAAGLPRRRRQRLRFHRRDLLGARAPRPLGRRPARAVRLADCALDAEDGVRAPRGHGAGLRLAPPRLRARGRAPPRRGLSRARRRRRGPDGAAAGGGGVRRRVAGRRARPRRAGQRGGRADDGGGGPDGPGRRAARPRGRAGRAGRHPGARARRHHGRRRRCRWRRCS